MAYEIEDDIMPLFLINGFLEAGKTQFLDFTIQQDYFKTEGKTLLIVCVRKVIRNMTRKS